MNPITLEELEQMRQTYLADPKARVVRHAAMKNDINQIARVFEAEADNPDLFSINIKTTEVRNLQCLNDVGSFGVMSLFSDMWLASETCQVCHSQLKQGTESSLAIFSMIQFI